MIKRLSRVVVAFFASVGVLAFIAGGRALETVLAAAVAALAFLVGEEVGLSTASPALSASPGPTERPNPTTLTESREMPYFHCDCCREEKREQPLLTEGGLVCRDCDSEGVYSRMMVRESRKAN